MREPRNTDALDDPLASAFLARVRVDVGRAFVLGLALALGACSDRTVEVCPNGTTLTELEVEHWLATREVGCMDESRQPRGPVFAWQGDRLLSVRLYELGSPNGTAVWWHPSGLLGGATTFDDGQPVRIAYIWDERGALTTELQHFPHDHMQTGETFYPNGATRTRYRFVEDELEGQMEALFPSGELHHYGQYKNSARSGRWSCRMSPGAPEAVAYFDPEQGNHHGDVDAVERCIGSFYTPGIERTE